jgi:hypothetical protein
VSPTFNVSNLSPFLGLEESRVTPFQEGEDDEDIRDICNPSASITPTVTPRPTQVTHKETSARLVTPSQALDTSTQVYKGPLTCSRAKLLQQEVHAFLSGLHPNIDENYILPKSCTLMLLKFKQEATLPGYMEDAVDYAKYTKVAAQVEKGYAPRPRVTLQKPQL